MLKCKLFAFMGKLLPDNHITRTSTNSPFYNGFIAQGEGDFFYWKNIVDKFFQNKELINSDFIDISTAASIKLSEECYVSKSDFNWNEVYRQIRSYPLLISKDTSLESAFVKFLEVNLNVKTDIADVMVFNGTYSAIKLISQALPGKKVLIPEFMNSVQKSSIKSVGKQTVEIKMHTPGWTYDLDDLDCKCKFNKGSVSFFYLHHLMPACISTDYLNQISDLLASHSITPVIDMDIFALSHKEGGMPIKAFWESKLRDKGIFLFTMSKELASPGIRIGFGIVPNYLKDELSKFRKKNLDMVATTSKAMALPTLCNHNLSETIEVLRDRMSVLVNGLKALKFEANLPYSGINLFMHVPRKWEASERVLPDHLFSYYCLSRAKVIIRPASVHGHRLNHFVRFVISEDSKIISEIINRFKELDISGDMDLPLELEEEYTSFVKSIAK
jgi:aspartate/methionine/tyrosine aminotransferase